MRAARCGQWETRESRPCRAAPSLLGLPLQSVSGRLGRGAHARGPVFGPAASNGRGIFEGGGSLRACVDDACHCGHVTGKEKEEEKMETHSKESQDLKTDPAVNAKKPLRARKTMTPTSRKQVELLKNLHGLGRAVQLKMFERECLNYYSNKETNTDNSKKLSAKEPVAKLVVNSEISIYDSSPKKSRDDDSSSDSSVTLHDLFLSLYEKERNSPVTKPVEVHIYSEQNSQTSDTPERTSSPSSDVPALDITEKKKKRTSSLSSDVPALDITEKKEKRTSSLSSDVPASGITEKKKETPKNSAAALLKQLHDNFEFRKEGSRSEGSWRNRKTSECEQEVSCKQITSSVETQEASTTQAEKSQSRMEKVRCLIQSQVDNSLGDLDCKLQQLNERIEQTQCLRKHEGITIQIIKKISRLNRRVNSAMDFQKAQLSKKEGTRRLFAPPASLPSGQQTTTILNVSRPPSGNPDDPSVPSKRRSAQPGDVPSKTVRSSAKETSRAAEDSGVQGRNSADVQQNRASSDARISAEASCAPKNKLLIDLTEDDTNPGRKEVSVKANPPPESTTPKIPQATTEPSEEFPYLPPLPENGLDPKHRTLEDTLPPQRLELEVARIMNPKGIALRWNIREVDPRCAPIESFHLYICHKHKGTQSPWTKTNEIMALPLPMVCSISQVATSGTCYFTMKSRDIFGRFGPFCEIKSMSAE